MPRWLIVIGVVGVLGAALFLWSGRDDSVGPGADADIPSAAPVPELQPSPLVASREGSVAPLRAAEAVDAQGLDAADVRPAGTVPGLFADVGEPLVVTGRVVDGDGTPVAAATVWIVPNGLTQRAAGLDPEPYRSSSVVMYRRYDVSDVPLAQCPRTVTDEAGRFALEAPHVVIEDPSDHLSDGLPWPLIAVRSSGHTTHIVPCRASAPPAYSTGDIVVEPAASIRGRAVTDGGVPLAGVSVRALHHSRRNLQRGVEGPSRLLYLPELLSTVSSDDGRFTLDGLWEGGIVFELRAPGHVRQELDLDTQAGTPLDLGDVVMATGASISGRVLDANGQPVEGAEVRVTEREIKSVGVYDMRFGIGPDDDSTFLEFDRIGTRYERAMTDADGRFVIAGLDEPNYTIYADAPGHDPAKLTDVGPGEARAELRMPPLARLEVQLIAAEDGTPITDAVVTAERLWCTRRGSHIGRRALPVTAPGADPHFAIEGVGSVATMLHVSAEGFAQQSVELAGVAPGTVSQERVVLTLEGTISGRVLGPDRQPLADARVLLGTPGNLRYHRDAVRTDSEGRYRFAGRGVGAVGLRARTAGMAESEERVVSLGAGEHAQGIDFVLVESGTISGTVFGSDGEPAPDKSVALDVEPFGRFKFMQTSDAFETRVTTDARGHYVFRDLPPDKYELTVSVGGREVVELAAGEQRRQDIRLPTRPRARGRVLSGGEPVVGVAIKGELVGAGIGGWVRPQTTDANGTYTVELLTAGTYELYVRTPNGSESARKTIELAEGDVTVVDFELPDNGITGRVSWDDSGLPVEGLEVTLNIDGNAYVATSQTDAEGRFAFRHLTPGTYRVHVTGYGQGRGRSIMCLPVWAESRSLGQDDMIDHGRLPVCRGARLTGRVRTPAGVPVKDGVEVQLVRLGANGPVPGAKSVMSSDGDGSMRFIEHPTDFWKVVRTEGGTYVVEALEAGEYRVTANAGSADEAIEFGATVTLGEHDELELDVAARP